jgi:5-methylcytosine-specific restriction endonuclease McrA
LGEGLFTATYKYALLLAFADLAVEIGDDTDRELEIETNRIAEKFIEYYFRQTLPFLGTSVLLQNKGKPPVVVTLLVEARNQYGDSLAMIRRDSKRWNNLVGAVSGNIRAMPLRYLQNVGGETLAFLYEPPMGLAPRTIRLYPGVAFAFRRFHGLICELVQGAWARWVRQQNLAAIGEFTDLHEFLFGAKRAFLGDLLRPLQEVQRGLCFYCEKELRSAVDVDHFVPWALYQLDLGHNFVLAHRDCNLAKRDRLASEAHLESWVRRNQLFGDALGKDFDRIGVLHNMPSTDRIARWAYNAADSVSGLVWSSKERLVPLDGKWRELLA